MIDALKIPAPPPAAVLYDPWGHAYVPLHPSPGMVNVPVTVLELVELWRLSIHAAAWCAAQSRAEEWAYHEQRGQHLLKTARDLNPLLVRMFEEPPHFGSEGKT
jgi:hypothetical protein